MKLRIFGVLTIVAVFVDVPLLRCELPKNLPKQSCVMLKVNAWPQIADGLSGLKNIAATDFAYIPPSVQNRRATTRCYVSCRNEGRHYGRCSAV